MNDSSADGPLSSVDTAEAPESRDAVPRVRIRSRALSALLVLGVLYTAYFAREVLIPIALAILFTLILIPPVRLLRRYLRVPPPLGAALMVGSLIAGIATGFYALATPAAEWAERLPQVMYELERKIYPFRKPMQEIQDAAQQVEEVAKQVGDESDTTLAVVVDQASLTETIVGETTVITVGFFVTAFLVLFLLANGDTLLRQAVSAAPRLKDKKRVIGIVREIEDDVSYYLGTVTLINCGLGIAVGLATWLAGMPNALLWGVMAGALNFIPYLGGIIGISVLALASVITFDTTIQMIVPPLAYVMLTAIEGYLVTPALLARRLVLNPVAVFVALIVATWMWGVVGALIAVPLLAAFKIVCDHIEDYHTIGILLGRPERTGNGA